MLGYVTTSGQGAGDRLLAAVASRLTGVGWPVAGVIQLNIERDAPGPCHMDLHVLAGSEVIRISQNLGSMSRGCRLDPGGIEEAVGLVEQALAQTGAGRPRLLIVNKFGKQEAEGRGFRPVIGKALGDGVPVLTSVSESNLPAFHAFAGALAESIEPAPDPILAWAGLRLSPPTTPGSKTIA